MIQTPTDAMKSYGYMWWLNQGPRTWEGVPDHLLVLLSEPVGHRVKKESRARRIHFFICMCVSYNLKPWPSNLPFAIKANLVFLLFRIRGITFMVF